MELTFGQQIGLLRMERKLSLRETARQVRHLLRTRGQKGRFTASYLSYIENDKLPPPSAAAIEALSRVLDGGRHTDELLLLGGRLPDHIRKDLMQHSRLRWRMLNLFD